MLASGPQPPASGKPKIRHRLRSKFGRHGDPPAASGANRDTEVGPKKPKQKFPVMGQIRATLFNSWINVLLIAVPVGIIINYLHLNPVAIFVVNFIAIIPLAALLSYATEEIAIRVGETLGGLLNASFG